MTSFSMELVHYLMKHYDLHITNASIMVEDEWDFVEQNALLDEGTVEHVAKELMNIYMVA